MGQTSFRLGTDQVGPSLCFSFLKDPNANTNTNIGKYSYHEPQPNSTVLRPVLDLELTRLVHLCASHFSKIQIQIQTQILRNTVILNHNQSQHNSDHFLLGTDQAGASVF